MTKKNNKTPKIALFHAFFKNRGGAERVAFAICRHFGADLWAGAIRTDIFDPKTGRSSTDPFTRDLFNPTFNLTYLHQDLKTPGIMHIWRMLNFIFNPRIKDLAQYDIVLFTGNVFWIQRRLKRLIRKKTLPTKLVTYCHTPPRPFTDREQEIKSALPRPIRPLYSLLARAVRYQYRQDMLTMDLIISNSCNIQSRLKTYIGIESVPIYPPVETSKFTYKSTGDFYLSHSRLEDAKRIKHIVNAFARMPDKKLILCSSGPLKHWVIDFIQSHQCHNIIYEGIVTDERLSELISTCIAGIVIPINEDAGIVQCELMAAGKPVIGVKEGGLLETVIDGTTGILISPNPTIEDVIAGVTYLNAERAIYMRQACEQHARQFDESVFYNKLGNLLDKLFIRE